MLLPLPLRRRGVDGKDQRDLERVVPKALFLIEPCESPSASNPPLALRKPLPLPPRLLPSPRAMRRVLAFARACPAASPNLPSAAARSCRAARRAATAARAARSEDLAQSDCRSELSAAPRIASMPPAFPRRPNQTRAMLIPFYAADAPSAACAPRRSKTT